MSKALVSTARSRFHSFRPGEAEILLPFRANKVYGQRVPSPGCKIPEGDAESRGVESGAQDDGAPRADLGSLSAAARVSPGSALPRAWLCLSEMAMSPAIFELRLNARSADLQTPARIPTDVDIIKRAGYFGWDESAFIH